MSMFGRPRITTKKEEKIVRQDESHDELMKRMN